jgi:DNA invertase Pin-like site-specific DNA recombinase
MILTEAQEHELASVLAANNGLAAAKEELREIVFDALAAGIPLRRVADAAGVGHATVYRWLDEDDAA